MVSISPHRFLLGNQKPGSESAHQNESIGTIFMSHALNLSWNNLFQGVFFENSLFVHFKLKYTFYKNCCFWLSGTVDIGPNKDRTFGSDDLDSEVLLRTGVNCRIIQTQG